MEGADEELGTRMITEHRHQEKKIDKLNYIRIINLCVSKDSSNKVKREAMNGKTCLQVIHL